MRYVALKPCTFSGRKFYIGENIPSEFVENSAKRLVKYGMIAEMAEEVVEAPEEIKEAPEEVAEKPKRRSRKGDSK